MNILVIGGCGYKGSVFVFKLLVCGYKVYVLDIMWFGNYLVFYFNLIVIEGDVCNIDQINLDGVDMIIYLLLVVNDFCGDFDFKLIWEVSVLVMMQLVDKVVCKGVK